MGLSAWRCFGKRKYYQTTFCLLTRVDESNRDIKPTNLRPSRRWGSLRAGQYNPKAHDERPFAKRKCCSRLDFVVGVVRKIHKCKADFCTIAGAHALWTSNEHHAKIFFGEG